MAVLLGVDTGGTFTDAVLFDEHRNVVVAKAKSPTTHDDLTLCIGAAIDAVLHQSVIPAADISLVSLSTTLATNALVEGHRGRIALVSIGFSEAELSRGGLPQALDGDPVVRIDGGHDSMGVEAVPLDTDALRTGLRTIGEVDAVAITSQFSVRNPAHEVAARDLVVELTGRPVSCGFQLSSKLNGPKRALTSVLNARLLATIERLNQASAEMLAERNIAAPVMVVRGDGSLVAAQFAADRPIETILSGPAASIVGAAHLAGRRSAVVADIGGTTTDIAVLVDGQPALATDGAVVGGHQTMVEAVSITTHGLGGDSQVRIKTDRFDPRLDLGPQRVVPLSLVATTHEDLVLPVLQRQLDGWATRPGHGEFVEAVQNRRSDARDDLESQIAEACADGWVPAESLISGARAAGALQRLIERGAVRMAAFTPTDAAHVLGLQDTWNTQAAHLGATLLARLDNGRGQVTCESPEALAAWVVSSLQRRSAELVLDAALGHDGLDASATDSLAAAALDGHRGVVALRAGLECPLVALGASAHQFYPEVGALLDVELIVPEHAEVANALGAVVGRVRIAAQATVSQPTKGQFRVHLTAAEHDFGSVERAVDFATLTLAEQARSDAERAGAAEVEVTTAWTQKTAMVEGKEVFVEGTARAEATGRPKLG